MATSHQQTKATPTEEVKNGSAQNADTDMWAGFEKIETERYMYNPNEGCDLPLVGYAINLMPMPPISRGVNKATGQVEWQDWECFIIRTTRPTKALNREKEPVIVPPGKEVLIPATYTLSQHFTQVSTVPDRCFEVLINPKKKVKIGGGKTMWTWELGWNRNSQPRGNFGPAALLGKTQAPMLPSQGQSTASDIVAEGERSESTPF
jgi:hypothetical protein